MSFGFSISPDNRGAPTSTDMNFPSYATILKSGSKSAWTQVIAAGAVTADCYWLYVEIQKTVLASTDTSAVIDIGVDPAGGSSYSVLVADLLAGHVDDCNANNGNGGWIHYSIPVKITSGSSVAIRGQTVRGADTSASVCVLLMGGPTGSPFAGATVYTLGVSGTGGTAVTPGSGSSWGSWTNVGSTLAADCQAFILGVQPIAGTTVARNAYQYQIGVSSAAISPIYDVHTGTSEDITGVRPSVPAYSFVASGSQMQVRARANAGGTIENNRVAIYAVSAT